MGRMTFSSLCRKACPSWLRIAWHRLDSSAAGRRFARGVLWTVAGAAVSRGLLLVGYLVLARLLGRVPFGAFGIVQSTINLFSVFTGYGLGWTSAKYVAQFRRTDASRAGRILGLSSVVAQGTGAVAAIGLCLSAPWLAEKALAAPDLVGELRIGALVLFLTALNGSQVGALTGLEAFPALARVNCLAGVSAVVLLVAGTLLGGLQGALWGSAASALVSFLVARRALGKEGRSQGVQSTVAGCLREWPVLWTFSLPVVLAGALVVPVGWACNAILVNQPNGYGEMGIVSAATQWQTAILFLPQTLATITLPLLANLHGEGDVRGYRKLLGWNLLLNGGITLLAGGAVAALSPFILAAYGEGFEQGWAVLALLAAAAVLVALNDVVGQAIASAGTMWWGCAFNALRAAALLAGTAVFVPRGGAFGLAVATLVSWGLHSCWQAGYAAAVVRARERDAAAKPAAEHVGGKLPGSVGVV
jgi:O-antigen/teichoic acid export membrane protein